MASIATVVTRGFGSFGSVNLLPTLGYGIGAAAEPYFGCIHAMQCYVPGYSDQQAFVPGFEAKQEYVPGVSDMQSSC